MCRSYVPLLVGRPAAAARASSSACRRAAYAASSSMLELECPPTPPEYGLLECRPDFSGRPVPPPAYEGGGPWGAEAESEG